LAIRLFLGANSEGFADYLPISQAVGFAVLHDTPEGAKAVLVRAFNEAMATDKAQN